MIEKVYGILQEYEEYISNAKDQKKVLKKKINELTKLAELNEKHGIETDSIILSLDEIETEEEPDEYGIAQVSLPRNVHSKSPSPQEPPQGS